MFDNCSLLSQSTSLRWKVTMSWCYRHWEDTCRIVWGGHVNNSNEKWVICQNWFVFKGRHQWPRVNMLGQNYVKNIMSRGIQKDCAKSLEQFLRGKQWLVIKAYQNMPIRRRKDCFHQLSKALNDTPRWVGLSVPLEESALSSSERMINLTKHKRPG